MSRRLMVLITALIIGFIYFVSAAGIVSTNDGSHYALTRAFAETGGASIDRYIDLTARTDLGEVPPPGAYTDLSYFNGHFYSDRAPGTAILAVPFYLAGQAFGLATGTEARIPSVLLLPVLAGVALFLAVYGLARELGAIHSAALVTSGLVALGTLAWKYSTVLYNHVVAAALVAGASYLVIRWANHRGRKDWWLPAAASFMIGYAVLVDYVSVLLFAVFGLYLLIQRAGIKTWAVAIVAAFPPLVVLPLYNLANFGSPLVTSYSYHYYFEWARTLTGTYQKPIFEGLRFFIAGGEGLFAVSPFLILSVAGLAILARRRWRDALLIGSAVAIILLPLSMHTTYYGGGTNDTRYIFTVVPLLGAPLAIWLDRMIVSRRAAYRYVSYGLLGLLGAFSVLRAFLSLQSMFGHVAEEQPWDKALPAVQAALGNGELLPYLSEVGIFILAVAVIVLIVGVSQLPVLHAGRPVPVTKYLQAGGVAVTVLLLVSGFTLYHRAEAYAGTPDRAARLLAAGSNLLPNGAFESENGSLKGWRVFERAGSNAGGHESDFGVSLGPNTGMLQSSLVYIQPGKLHRLTWYARGEQKYAVDFVWENDLRQEIMINTFETVADPSWMPRTYECVAPLEATGLRIRFRAGLGQVVVDDIRLSQDGIRVEPMKDFGKASLAFTFDWETAMGGSIHSKGLAQPEAASAAEHGMRMRKGAENLVEIFNRYGVSGTFFATGYNLLDGNTEKRAFVGDPVYKWAAVKNGWASDFWKTNKWYEFDPYGTYESDPAWYFGDLTQRMLAAGQDIQTHTFGHLYVRGLGAKDLAADLEEWNKAAEARGMQRARVFAFPWRSSNSVKLPVYQVLADHGITAVTRQFRYIDEFELGAVDTRPQMIDYPDRQFTAEPEGEQKAASAVDEALERNAFTSLWAHPEDVADPKIKASWDKVVKYASEKRKDGLVVDSLTNIVDHYLGIRQLKVVYDQSGTRLSIAVKNTGQSELHGVTLTLPGIVSSAKTLDGKDLERQRDQILLPDLGASEGIEVIAELEY